MVSGAATPLTMLAPIQRGTEARLLAHLAELSARRTSPFRRVPSAHFARWVVIDEIPADYPGAPVRPYPLRSSYLAFTSTFNGPFADFVEELRVGLAADADAIWGRCVGYPGREHSAAFQRYFAAHRVGTGLWYAAHDASVEQVKQALDLRRRHIELAAGSHALDAAQLQAAFLDEFAGSGR